MSNPLGMTREEFREIYLKVTPERHKEIWRLVDALKAKANGSKG
jgi:hypothetical protein